jgi:hypothetical protein
LALSARGKFLVFLLAAILIGGGAAGYFFAVGGEGPGPLGLFDGKDEPPAKCPLTGLDPDGEVPNRPALAIKVENIQEARPQAGLETADVVYEQPVEGGITRFKAVYQCRDADRVGPVRSGRLVDPLLLTPLGSEGQGNAPLFGYAGGVQQVIDAVNAAGIVDVNYQIAVDAYHRDPPPRLAPHNLFTSTGELRDAAGNPSGAANALFTYTDGPIRGKGATSVHVPFSESADVFWSWNAGDGVYLRSHGTTPHTLESGAQVRARNVIVQVVETRCSGIVDVNGVCSPDVTVIGSGRAIVFTNGKVIEGTWTRSSEGDRTVFTDKRGREIGLRAGVTWVELLPTDRTPSFQ